MTARGRRGRSALGLAASLAALPAAALAQEAPAGPPTDPSEQHGSVRRARAIIHEAPRGDDTEDLTVDVGLSLVSDYRTGGLSSSLGDPAAQAWVSLAHRSGLYVSAWTSTLGGSEGGSVELQLAGGYAFAAGALEVDVGFIEYVFPETEDSDYLELQFNLAHPLGPATATLGLAYTPPQRASGERDNIYAGAGIELPVPGTPVTLAALAGIEDGAFGDAKLDWSLGATLALGRFDIGLTYIDTARSFAAAYIDATLVLAIEAHL